LDKHSDLFEQTTLGVARLATDGTWLEVNRRVCELTGYSAKELYAMNFADICGADYYLANLQLRKLLLKGELHTFSTEQEILRKDQSLRKVTFHVSPVRADTQGLVECFLLQITDIKQKSPSDTDFAKSLDRYKSLFYHHPDAVYSLDREGNFIEVNQALADIAETTREDIIGGGFARFIRPDELDKVLQHFNASLGGEVRKYTINGITVNGKPKVVDITNVPIYGSDGEIHGVYGVARDVTKSLQTEIERDAYLQTLQTRIREMQCLFGISSMLNESINIDTLLNRAMQLLPTAVKNPDMVVAGIQFKDKRYTAKGFVRTDKELMAEVRTHQGDLLRVCLCYRETDEKCSPEPFAQEEEQLVKSVADMLAAQLSRLEAERFVQEAEEKQKKLYHERERLLQSVEEGIYGIDKRGNCTFINKAALQALGYAHEEECMGQNVHRLIHHHRSDGSVYKESDCPIFMAKRISEGSRVSDDVFWRKDGSSFPVRYTASPVFDGQKHIGAVVAFTDITEEIAASVRLKSSETKYKNLFNASPLPKWVFDLQTLEILDANEAATHQFGFEKAQMLKMRITDLRCEQELKRLNSALREYRMEEGIIKAGIFNLVRCDKSEFQAEVCWHRIDFEGRMAMMVSAHDVTEREKAIDALIDRELKLEMAQRIAKLGYWQLNSATNEIKPGAEVYNILNFRMLKGVLTVDELIEHIHPDDISVFKSFLSDLAVSDHERFMEMRILLLHLTLIVGYRCAARKPDRKRILLRVCCKMFTTANAQNWHWPKKPAISVPSLLWLLPSSTMTTGNWLLSAASRCRGYLWILTGCIILRPPMIILETDILASGLNGCAIELALK
jgi:PAS domain S-box-containing protein